MRSVPILNADFLKQLSWDSRDPDFADEVQELELAGAHASRMLAAGKLTKSEYEDFQGHLYGKFLEALPINDFHEMMEDGRLDQLQALAGHDGTRDVGDVGDARNAIVNKIKADALDDAWLSQKISAEHYTRESREIDTSDRLNDQIADGDYDGAAAEMFASRNDVPDQDNKLLAYLKDKFGDAPTADAPPGYVDRQTELDPHDGFTDHDADEEN